MKINCHSGHAAVGRGAIGAVGILSESKENRIVKEYVIAKLKALGHTVYDCTVDDGDASTVLRGIVKKCNAHKVDIDVSIHFNAGAKDEIGNGKTTGVEVLVKKTTGDAFIYAQRVCNTISALGFRNRGVKTRTDLKYLNECKNEAILIECCFVDDKDDAKLYNAEKMANAIVEGITGSKVVSDSGNAINATKIVKYKTLTELNIRKGPGVLYSKVGVAPKGVYSIVEVNGNWGKLLSGAGWICITSKYATMV